MSTRIRHIFATLLLTAGALSLSGRVAAQPWLFPQSDVSLEASMCLPSEFLQSIRADRQLFAKSLYFESLYDQTVEQQLPRQALAYTDSLIYLSDSHHLAGVHFTRYYTNRALLLREQGMLRDACVAFDRAITVQDSLMRQAQSETIREMQSSYQLDKLALDRALLRARQHQVVLISISLLFIATLASVGFIYYTNRRIQRLREELLMQTQHSEESEKKKLAFINSICHEVRTPLNCIAGFSELMCAEDTNAEAYVQYSDIIRRNSQQLRYIFDDILEVAFLESSQEPLPRVHLDLAALCRTQLHSMKAKAGNSDVLYTHDIPAGELIVDANPKYLPLLFTLLLSNARKFTPEGFIRIECGRTEDNKPFFAVADTGCGIPPEEHERVFERFCKLDTFSQGNGLGLYLARLIVRNMGGEIHIDPVYRGGTRIVVTLPET